MFQKTILPGKSKVKGQGFILITKYSNRKQLISKEVYFDQIKEGIGSQEARGNFRSNRKTVKKVKQRKQTEISLVISVNNQTY